MNTQETDKSIVHTTADLIDYVQHAIHCKTILKKITGSVSILSVDTGEGIVEKTNPFDTYIQVIEGDAEIIINNNSHLLHSGQSIIVPPHVPHSVNPNGRFKMILTIIKSGYE